VVGTRSFGGETGIQSVSRTCSIVASAEATTPFSRYNCRSPSVAADAKHCGRGRAANRCMLDTSVYD
jgi:hypothetical protein